MYCQQSSHYGVENINVDYAYADAEMISMGYHLFEKMGKIALEIKNESSKRSRFNESEPDIGLEKFNELLQYAETRELSVIKSDVKKNASCLKITSKELYWIFLN